MDTLIIIKKLFSIGTKLESIVIYMDGLQAVLALFLVITVPMWQKRKGIVYYGFVLFLDLRNNLEN